MRTKLESARIKFDEWRNQRTLASEAGHKPFPFAGQPKTAKDIFGEYGETDTEIDIYIHPEWDVTRHNEVYNQSVNTEEDPRLKD